MTPGPEDSLTHASLLLRVGRSPTDETAWAEFVYRYGPKILAWGRGWGLQPADAEDVAQSVLLKIARHMERFSYDPSRSFRGWLRCLSRRAWQDWAARRGDSPLSGGGDEIESKIQSLEAREDLLRRLEETFDLEVLIEAVHRVRERVTSQSWEAYRLTAQEGLPAAAVADRLGMKAPAVFKAKSHVLKLIREEVQALEAGADDDSAASSISKPAP